MYEFQPERGKRGYAFNFVFAMAAYGKTFLTPGRAVPPPEWLPDPHRDVQERDVAVRCAQEGMARVVIEYLPPVIRAGAIHTVEA